MTEVSWVYRLHPAIAIEDFGERSLALHCDDLRLIELNATARDLLARLNGQASVGQIAAAIANDYGQPVETVLEDIRAVVVQMAGVGIVERVE